MFKFETVDKNTGEIGYVTACCTPHARYICAGRGLRWTGKWEPTDDKDLCELCD